MDNLSIIFKNLKSGCIYGRVEKYRFYSFSHALSYDKVTNLFRWTYYGSSANKATKAQLAWIIKNIFGMTYSEFIKTFQCFTSWYEIENTLDKLEKEA